MHNMRSNRRFVFIVLTLGFALPAIWAQPPKKIPNQDPSQNPRKVSTEMKDAYKKWVTEEVSYILTPAEKKAFLALKTDEERENFIAIFWKNRDPNPDTEENEFREEYYERLAYANENFASGIPGWRTDRGRIYIMWGKPDSVESRPSGGAYDRPSYEGGGSITTYPFETWFYRRLKGVGDGIEIEFVDRTGSGEYKIARDFDEKNVAATAGYRTDRGDNNLFMRQQDTPLARAELIKNLETPPRVKFTDLDQMASGDSGTIDNNPLEFDLRIDYFRQSEDRVIAAFTIQTDNKELAFKSLGGVGTATINIFGRITAVSNKRSGIFEDSVTTNATPRELAELREKKFAYQKLVALAPGIYKVAVVVRDVESGNKGIVNMGFTVPRYTEGRLSSSSLILASKLRPADGNDIGKMFVIGKEKVMPNLSGVYKQGQEVGLYQQVYNAGIDETTLRPAVDVDYVLLKNGKEISRTKEDWSGLSDSGQQLTLARLLPTAQITPGDYEVKVVIKDRVAGQVIENTGKFSVTK